MEYSQHDSHVSPSGNEAVLVPLPQNTVEDRASESESVDDFLPIDYSKLYSSDKSLSGFQNDTRISKYLDPWKDSQANRESSAALWEERFVKYIKNMPIPDNMDSPEWEPMYTKAASMDERPFSSLDVMSHCLPDASRDNLRDDSESNRADKRTPSTSSTSSRTIHQRPISSHEQWEDIERSSPIGQNGRISTGKKKAPQIKSTVEGNKEYPAHSEHNGIDIQNLDSKFQRVLNRRLFGHGIKDTKPLSSKRSVTVPQPLWKQKLYTHHNEHSSNITPPLAEKNNLPPAVENKLIPKNKTSRLKAPYHQKPFPSSLKATTKAESSIYISDSSDEDELVPDETATTTVARKVGPRSANNQSTKALVPAKRKVTAADVGRNTRQPLKRTRRITIDITDDSNEDQFPTTRRRILETLHAERRRNQGGQLVVTGTKGRTWQV